MVPVEDKSAAVETISRDKATSEPGSVGAPMSGVVVEVRVKEGQEVKKGDILCVQSAMKVRSEHIELVQPLTRYPDGECGFGPREWPYQTCRRPRGRQSQPRRPSRRNCALVPGISFVCNTAAVDPIQ